MCAVEDQKYDVARLTLKTLLNTYPDSDYAAEAQEVLHDSRLGCGPAWSVPPLDGRGYPDSDGGMTFFPADYQ